MRQGSPSSANPSTKFSRKQQTLWGIVVGIAFIAIGAAMVLFFIMAEMIDKQGASLNGVVPLKGFGAVIILLLLTTLIPNNGKDS